MNKITKRSDLEKLFNLEAENFDLTPQVISDGPIGAQVAIIGEGPGESEMRSGIPFSGGSGKILLDEMRKLNLGRHNIYITNVVKRQISLSSKTDARHAVSRHELSKWIALLQWELRQLPNLKYILVMGNYALEAVLQQSGITDWRGSVLENIMIGDKPVSVAITYNPAYVLREPKLLPVFKMDCYKFGRVISGKFRRYEIKAIINPTLDESLDYIFKLKSEGKPVSLDIETTSYQPACFGLSNDPNEAICINLRDETSNRFDLDEELKLLRAIQDLCLTTPIIAQNGIFDAYYTWLKLGIRIPIWFDTMLAHHLLYPQLPHSLQFLTAQYTTHPFYKDEGKLWKEGGDIDAFWRYNCKDAAVTFKVHEALYTSLKKHKLDKFFFEHVMRIQPHLVQATVHGIKCDIKLKSELKNDLSEDVQSIRTRFDELVSEAVGDPHYSINPNSPRQLGELLFKHLRLRGRGVSTDANNRKKMLVDPRTSPIAKEILTTLDQYKKEAKFLSTYVDARIDDDERFRTVYKQHGVSRAPGRLSSSGTIDGTGMNLQNIPHRGYNMFVADPGTVFIYLDASQAEARVVGWYYDIEKWKEDFERARLHKDYDVHRALASEMFKIPYDEVPVEDFDADHRPTKRFIGKRCRHGLNYRMQAFRLSEVTELPYHQAKNAYSLYHALTPELRRGWAKEEQKVRRTHELVNAYGRPWRILQRIDDNVLESIIAFYPQSTVGDHVQRAWYMAEEDDKWPRGHARVIMNVHDALVGLAEPKYAKKALSILQKHMEHPIMITNLYGTKTEPLIIPAECKISEPDEGGVHRWSGLKKVTLT